VKKYTKYVLKDTKHLALKLFAIVLIVALGVSFLVGLLTAAPNMRYTLEQYYINSNVADMIVQKGLPFTTEEVDALAQNNLIKEIMPYFEAEETININDRNYVARITLFDFENGFNINNLQLLEGRFPENSLEKLEIVVSHSQAYTMNMFIGQKITFWEKSFEVVGIVKHPLRFANIREVSEISQRTIDCAIYTDYNHLQISGPTHVALILNKTKNYSFFSNEYKVFVDDNINELKNIFGNFFFKSLNQTQDFVQFQSDIKIVEIISLIFPVFFFLITILVSMSSITRIIADQRLQIGTLRSLGYSKSKIMWKYVFYALLSSGVGCVLGIALGIYFIPAIIYNAYSASYQLPSLIIHYNVLYISIISVIMVFFVLITTLISINSVLKQKPAQLLKVKSPKAGKKILLEKTALWKRLSFKYKSTIRNIFRHRQNLILTLIGIAGSTALLLAGFGIKNSIDYAGEFQYQQMLNYQMEIGVVDAEIDIPTLENIEQILVMNTTAKYEGNYINIVIPENTQNINNFISFENIFNKKINMQKNSVFVTQPLAVKYNLKSGDELSLSMQNGNVTVTITDIIKYSFGNVVYISNNVASSQLTPTYNKIYAKTSLANEQKLYDELINQANVLHVLLKKDLSHSFNEISKSMNGVVLILLGSACALAVIINYNLTLINISTRHRDLATLKVLGYNEIEVSGYIFRETLIISCFAILFGLGLGALLHAFIISRIIIDGIIFPRVISWVSYIITAILSLFFLSIVYLLSIPKTKKIDMVEALKSYD